MINLNVARYSLRAIILITMLVVTTGCGLQETPGPPPSRSSKINDAEFGTDATEQPVLTPQLWQDQDVASIVKSMYAKPIDTVYVIRWKHGDLRGSLNLDAPKQSPPGSSKLNISAVDFGADQVEDLSGILIIVMQKLPDAPGEVFDVRIDGLWSVESALNASSTSIFDDVLGEGDLVQTSSRKRTTYALKTRQGRVTRLPFGNTEMKSGDGHVNTLMKSGDGFQFIKWDGEQEVVWLDLKVVNLNSRARESKEE